MLLEKGIYQEQTAGDVDAAMEIYRRIIEDDRANRPLAAQAQYRLGLCYLKKKQADAAAESFRKVVSLYPEQQDLVAQAQRDLERLGANGGKSASPKPARPGVIRTNPPALANDVDPSLDKITVMFNHPMMDRSWSWTGSGPMYPKTTGSPSYDAARRVCSLPVKLEPGKVYQIGVNSKSFKNFKTAAGTPVPWYMIVFATRSADGKPTPIPQELQQQARAINRISDAQVGTSRQDPPRVVRTTPRAFADNVAASLDKITVTFDQAMLDGHWSWTGGGETFPKTVGDIHYDAAKRTCTLPVKLEPGKVYWVGMNSPSYQYFQAADGTPAERYVILFATESADGKATPIPQDLLDAAKEINGASAVTGQASGDAAVVSDDPDRRQAIEGIFANPEPIETIAKKIFEGIRTADYDRWINGERWGSFPITQYYQTYQWYDVLVPWICKTFKADPIQEVSLAAVVKNEDGLPAIPYKLTLASGKVMEGMLPFNYEDGRWYARWGLDWHLGKRMRLTEARKTTPPLGPAKVEMRVIGKPVSAFAEGDLSAPESAAANYCRASGNMDAEALAAVSITPVDGAAMQRAFERNRADMEIYNKAQLNATILQVLTYRDGVARVIVKLSFPPGVGRHPFSGRTFGLFGGQWKNMGEDRYPSPQAARVAFERGKDAIWDDYMQVVEQNGGGGEVVGARPLPAADTRTGQ